MAAQISHMLAGEDALKEALGVPGAEALGRAAPAFMLGCQGPDIFYHNQRTKPSGLHYGSLAHRRNYGSLIAGMAGILPEADRSPESPRGAYVLGLATHAAVDRATHPFIICFAGWSDPSDPSTARRRGCHPFLERLLDAGILERRLGISPAEYGVSARMGNGLPVSEGLDASLVAIWEAGLRAAFRQSASSDALIEARVANALADARSFYDLTDPASAARGRWRKLSEMDLEEARYVVTVVYPLRVPEGMDTMNESRGEWPHPAGDGRVFRSSYPETMGEGAAEAARSIGLVLAFWKGGIGAAELAAGIGEGGLGLSGARGEAAIPRTCRPLALPEAIDAELALRLEMERRV